MENKLIFLWKKWSIALKIAPFLAVIIILKLVVHRYGWEIISLNTLFTSLIAATIFLLGFLITGVLSDYKESEKLPGELVSSIEVLHDETSIVYKQKKSQQANEFLSFQLDFVKSLLAWFYNKEGIDGLFDKLKQMNDHFLSLESQTQAGFIARMKQEQNNIRKAIIRIHTIRETSFVVSAYAISEV